MPTNQQWLAAEPFTLALSAGFFGFYAHAGFLCALHEAGVTPRRIVGVSAGAIAGGLYAAGLAPRDIERELLQLQRGDFWDPDWRRGGLLRGDKFAHKLQQVLAPTGVHDLEDCPIVFNPVVFDIRRRQTVVLHRGPIGTAIRASSALPALFRPVRVEGRLVVDGGLRDRPGVTGLGVDERVMVHNLVSSSPWRHLFKRTLLINHGTRRTLEASQLPRVTPFALNRGAAALAAAYEATVSWLSLDIWGAGSAEPARV